jgi:hypothetical protein
METTRASWVAPLTGVIFVVLFAAVLILTGEGKDATEESAEEIIDFYQDNEAKNIIASFLIGLAAIAMLFFGGYLRRLLRDAEGPNGILSAVAFGGAIAFASGALVGGNIHFALTELADETPDPVDPSVIQSLNAIDNFFFFFFPVGLGTLLLASGISVVRHGVLPKWLGWLAIVCAVAFITPAFPIGLVGGPLWILIVSVMGIMRARGSAGSPAPSG